MDFSKIYRFGPAFVRGALHVDAVNAAYNDFPDEMLRGEYRPEEPVVFRDDSGGRARDFVASTAGHDIVSPKVLEILGEHHCTGWSTWPVELCNKHGEKLEGYAGLVIAGRCGPLDATNSKRIWSPPITAYGKGTWKLQGLEFDPESWDGSDLFCPADRPIALMSDKVYQALKKGKVTNFSATPLSEYQFYEADRKAFLVRE